MKFFNILEFFFIIVLFFIIFYYNFSHTIYYNFTFDDHLAIENNIDVTKLINFSSYSSLFLSNYNELTQCYLNSNIIKCYLNYYYNIILIIYNFLIEYFSFNTIFFNDIWGRNLLLNNSHKSYRPLSVLLYRFAWLLSDYINQFYPSYSYLKPNVLLRLINFFFHYINSILFYYCIKLFLSIIITNIVEEKEIPVKVSNVPLCYECSSTLTSSNSSPSSSSTSSSSSSSISFSPSTLLLSSKKFIIFSTFTQIYFSLIFLIHPIHIEDLVAVVNISESFYSLLNIISFLIFRFILLENNIKNKKILIFIFILLNFLSLFIKETSIISLLYYFIYIIYYMIFYKSLIKFKIINKKLSNFFILFLFFIISFLIIFYFILKIILINEDYYNLMFPMNFSNFINFFSSFSFNNIFTKISNFNYSLIYLTSSPSSPSSSTSSILSYFNVYSNLFFSLLCYFFSYLFSFIPLLSLFSNKLYQYSIYFFYNSSILSSYLTYINDLDQFNAILDHFNFSNDKLQNIGLLRKTENPFLFLPSVLNLNYMDSTSISSFSSSSSSTTSISPLFLASSITSLLNLNSSFIEKYLTQIINKFFSLISIIKIPSSTYFNSLTANLTPSLSYSFYNIKSLNNFQILIDYNKKNYFLIKINFTKPFSYIYLYMKYLILLIFPSNQSPEYSFSCINSITSYSDPRIIFVILFIFLFLIIIIFGLKILFLLINNHLFNSYRNENEIKKNNYKSRNTKRNLINKINLIIFELLIYFILSFLPLTNIFFSLGTLLAERLLYFPSFLFFLALFFYSIKFFINYFFNDIILNNKKKSLKCILKNIIFIFFIIFYNIFFYFYLTSLSSQTISYSSNWKSDVNLFLYNSDRCSTSSKAQLQVSKLYSNSYNELLKKKMSNEINQDKIISSNSSYSPSLRDLLLYHRDNSLEMSSLSYFLEKSNNYVLKAMENDKNFCDINYQKSHLLLIELDTLINYSSLLLFNIEKYKTNSKKISYSLIEKLTYEQFNSLNSTSLNSSLSSLKLSNSDESYDEILALNININDLTTFLTLSYYDTIQSFLIKDLSCPFTSENSLRLLTSLWSWQENYINLLLHEMETMSEIDRKLAIRLKYKKLNQFLEHNFNYFKLMNKNFRNFDINYYERTYLNQLTLYNSHALLSLKYNMNKFVIEKSFYLGHTLLNNIKKNYFSIDLTKKNDINNSNQSFELEHIPKYDIVLINSILSFNYFYYLNDIILKDEELIKNSYQFLCKNYQYLTTIYFFIKNNYFRNKNNNKLKYFFINNEDYNRTILKINPNFLMYEKFYKLFSNPSVISTSSSSSIFSSLSIDLDGFFFLNSLSSICLNEFDLKYIQDNQKQLSENYSNIKQLYLDEKKLNGKKKEHENLINSFTLHEFFIKNINTPSISSKKFNNKELIDSINDLSLTYLSLGYDSYRDSNWLNSSYYFTLSSFLHLYLDQVIIQNNYDIFSTSYLLLESFPSLNSSNKNFKNKTKYDLSLYFLSTILYYFEDNYNKINQNIDKYINFQINLSYFYLNLVNSSDTDEFYNIYLSDSSSFKSIFSSHSTSSSNMFCRGFYWNIDSLAGLLKKYSNKNQLKNYLKFLLHFYKINCFDIENNYEDKKEVHEKVIINSKKLINDIELLFFNTKNYSKFLYYYNILSSSSTSTTSSIILPSSFHYSLLHLPSLEIINELIQNFS